jgi:hypothetical protein
MHDGEFILLTAWAICQRLRKALSNPWRRASALLGFAAATWSATAHAQGATEAGPAKAFRVVFSSSTSCTDESEFATRLQAMTSRWRPAQNGEPSYTFFIHLTATQAGAHGQLGILEPTGSLSLREVETADCHTVLTALAFIGAVRADPLTPPPPQPLPLRPDTLRPRRARSLEQSQNVKPWHFGFGPGFGIEGGVAPRPAPALSVHAELGHTTGVLFDTRARLSLRVAESTARFAAGSAAFTWVSARLALCPLRLQPFPWLDARPCAFVDAGKLSAQGFETVQNKSDSLFWSAAGVELMLDLLHAGPLTLGAEGGITVPFRHDGFYFEADPEASVHTIPNLSATGSLSLSLRVF